ncbi:MAG TPA: hypothetical protein PKG90_03605 [Chitinophagaceae bacterium]|nr:hypothetical protein [Chitinophagaceae bacterium]
MSLIMSATDKNHLSSFLSTVIFAAVKKIVAIIFVIIFSLQLFYTTGFTIWFFVNRTTIAREHCINKDRPELKCDGKCFLNKKIKETEQHQNEEAPLQIKQLVEGSPCTISTISCTIASPEVNLIHNPISVSNNYSFDHIISVFRPPSLS